MPFNSAPKYLTTKIPTKKFTTSLTAFSVKSQEVLKKYFLKAEPLISIFVLCDSEDNFYFLLLLIITNPIPAINNKFKARARIFPISYVPGL